MTEMCNDSVICETMIENSTQWNNSFRFSLNPEATVYFTTALVLMWINTVLIVFLNIAVIIIILRYKKKSRLYFLLLNLAVADLVTGMSDALPNAVERSVGMPYLEMLWVFGVAPCKIQRALASVSMTSSNYILAVMSLDRAMVIYSPMRAFRKGKLLHKVTMLVCWTLSALCCSPLLQFMDVVPADMAPAGYYKCSMVWGDLDHMLMWKLLTIVMFIIVFAIPLVIIAISYVILLVSIYSLSKMTDQGTAEHRPSFFVFNSGLPRSKAKSIRLTFGIILSFIICWLIFFVFVFNNVFNGYNGSFLMIAMTFYYWNSVANPVLFFIYHRNRTFSSRTSLNASVKCNAQNNVVVQWSGPSKDNSRKTACCFDSLLRRSGTDIQAKECSV